jgi:hypothetical protein
MQEFPVAISSHIKGGSFAVCAGDLNTYIG